MKGVITIGNDNDYDWWASWKPKMSCNESGLTQIEYKSFINMGSEDLWVTFKIVFADDRNRMRDFACETENVVPATRVTPKYLTSLTWHNSFPYIVKTGWEGEEPKVNILTWKDCTQDTTHFHMLRKYLTASAKLIDRELASICHQHKLYKPWKVQL